ncbi:MAG: hypothetical protein ACP5N9_00790 [Candidatus Bilamarchaeum sp.]|jgi:hypothetical protein
MGGVRVRSHSGLDHLGQNRTSFWAGALLASTLAYGAGLKTASAQDRPMVETEVVRQGGQAAAARVELTSSQMITLLGTLRDATRPIPDYANSVRTALGNPTARVPSIVQTQLDQNAQTPVLDLFNRLINFRQVAAALNDNNPEVVRAAEQSFGSVVDARRVLSAASAAAVRSLATLISTTSDLAPLRAQIAPNAEQISDNLADMTAATSTSAFLSPVSRDLSALVRFVQGQEVMQLTSSRRTSVEEAGRVERQRLYNPTLLPFHIIAGTGDTYASVSATVTRPLGSIYRVPSSGNGFVQDSDQYRAAQEFGNAISQAVACSFGRCNVSPDEALTRLGNALNSVPADNSSLRNDPHYRAAIEIINRGGPNALRDALNEITQGGPLGSIVGQIVNGVYAVRVSTQAITIDIGLNTHIIFPAGSAAFERYMDNPSGGHFSFLEFGFQVTQSWLALNGQYERLAPQMVNGQLQFNRVGQPQSFTQGFTPENSATTFRPSLTMGVGVGGRPFEVTVYAELVTRRYDLEIPVERQTASGTTRRETLNVGSGGGLESTVGGSNFALGITGIEIRPRERPTEVFRAYVPRRVGVAGLQGGFLAYTTFDLTPDQRMGRSNIRLDTFVTPQFSYLLDQARLSAEISPQLVWQPNPNVSLLATPLVRYEYNISGETHRMDVGGSLGVQLPRAGFGLSLHGRYGFNIGESSPLTAPPEGISAGLMIDITPQRWFGRSAQDRATLSRVRISPLIAGVFIDCLNFQSENPGDLSNNETAQQYARALAVRLSSGGPHPLSEVMHDNQNFTQALTSLNAGNLTEGLRLLRLIPRFEEIAAEQNR